MKVIAFLTDYAVVDRIINHLKLSFVADKPPPPHIAYQEVLMAAETTRTKLSSRHSREPREYRARSSRTGVVKPDGDLRVQNRPVP
jgi:hypothetical protein